MGEKPLLTVILNFLSEEKKHETRKAYSRDGSGVVNTTDAKLIMQKDLGLIEEFPAGG